MGNMIVKVFIFVLCYICVMLYSLMMYCMLYYMVYYLQWMSYYVTLSKELCVRHLYNNFRKNYPGKLLKDII